MKFLQVDLYRAVYAARNSDLDLPVDPQSTTEREQIYRAIQAKLPPDVFYTLDDICSAWVGYRKNGRKHDLTVDVANAHGCRCFWANRGLGPCSDDLTVDRLVPGSLGGQYTVENCVVSCGRHNSKRGNRTIEEMLAMDREHSSPVVPDETIPY
jgi:hypothetical protein